MEACIFCLKKKYKAHIETSEHSCARGQYFLLIKKQTRFENINLEPTLHYGKIDKTFKNKLLNNSCCSKDR